MGLFGSSKKDRQIEQLQQELNALRSMVSPGQYELLSLQEQIAVIRNQLEQEETEFYQKQETQQQTIQFLDSEIKKRKKEIQEQECSISQLSQQIRLFNEEINTIDCGLYQPAYEFASSDLYKNELIKVRKLQKDMIKAKTACTGAANWQVNGSTSKGEKMVADMQKLLLRAFNSECDDIISHVRVSNYERSVQRIHAICSSISKLGQIMQISITERYVSLKIRELDLALDFAQKKEQEKERLRELREQQREEAKAQKEIEEARKKLAKEQSHYQNALRTLISQLETDPQNANLLARKSELESNIADVEKAIVDVDYRQANRRAGYVYIISNIGAFGEGIYKIGMTRRLDPMDRVNELGDASVPFRFDVHALIFTDDAPKLEAALHTAFASQKVNKINPRREFFRVSLEEIKQVVRDNFDKTVEWIDVPEAEQYRQSLLCK